MVQGFYPGFWSGIGFALGLLVLLLVAPARAASGCETLPLRRLAPGLWLVPAPAAESDAGNRGHSSHLLLARDGPRLWAVGSGPTPAFGARLRCTAQRQLGLAPTDLIVPWARAELALGMRGLAPRRAWAHARVAEAMAEQCPRCVDRLRQRLGLAAADLGDDPVRLPSRQLQGDQGRLGPFDWWALPRAEGRVVTVLRHRASGVASAHGLLWGDGPPDLRDADPAQVESALLRLSRWGLAGTRWVGESGPLLSATDLLAQAGYVQALRAAARLALERGGDGLEAPDLPPTAAAVAGGPQPHARHMLNWQRVWREAEDRWLDGKH